MPPRLGASAWKGPLTVTGGKVPFALSPSVSRPSRFLFSLLFLWLWVLFLMRLPSAILGATFNGRTLHHAGVASPSAVGAPAVWRRRSAVFRQCQQRLCGGGELLCGTSLVPFLSKDVFWLCYFKGYFILLLLLLFIKDAFGGQKDSSSPGVSLQIRSVTRYCSMSLIKIWWFLNGVYVRRGTGKPKRRRKPPSPAAPHHQPSRSRAAPGRRRARLGI